MDNNPNSTNTGVPPVDNPFSPDVFDDDLTHRMLQAFGSPSPSPAMGHVRGARNAYVESEPITPPGVTTARAAGPYTSPSPRLPSLPPTAEQPRARDSSTLEQVMARLERLEADSTNSTTPSMNDLWLTDARSRTTSRTSCYPNRPTRE